MVPIPTTRVAGTVGSQAFEGAGGLAHIDGHGSAKRWVWLHADLGNDDVLEVVAATARRPGMRALPPLPFVQLPPQRCVSVGYVDPDASTATCLNSEAADAVVRVDRLSRHGWVTQRSWTLDATAHAEIGTRP